MKHMEDKNKEVLTEENGKEAFASTAMPVNIADPTAILTLSNAIVPSDRIMRIKKAKKYRDVDLVNRLLQMRVDYALNIKGIKCKNKRQKRFYEENVLPLLRKLAREFEYEFHSIGDVYVHFGFKSDDKTPLFLKLETAEDIEAIDVLGFQRFKIVISPEFKKQLREIAKDKSVKLPKYIRNIIDDTAGKTIKIMGNHLTLDGENMYRCTNLKQSYETYPMPPLLRIAKAIELRELLLECDFTSGLSIKNSIIHTRVGTKEKPAPPTRVQQVHGLLENQPTGTFFLTTGYDVEIKKVDTVDPNTWNPAKYTEANQRILQFFGISLTLIPNADGNSYSSGVLSIKPFEQSLKSDRKVFNEFVEHYFDLINERNNFKEKVVLDYEKNNLRDTSEMLKELQFLFDTGVVSFEDLCIEYDYDRDEQVEKREWDWENRDTIAPYYEASQGLQPVLDHKMKQQADLKEMGMNSQNNGETGESGRPKENGGITTPTNNPRP